MYVYIYIYIYSVCVYIYIVCVCVCMVSYCRSLHGQAQLLSHIYIHTIMDIHTHTITDTHTHYYRHTYTQAWYLRQLLYSQEVRMCSLTIECVLLP